MKFWLTGVEIAVFLCTIRAMVYDIDRCNPEQFLGDWHVLAFATDCKQVTRYLDDMEMMVATVKRQEGRSFKVTSLVPMPLGCLKMEEVFSIREDGAIVHKSDFGEETVNSLQTDCETYSILTLSRVKNQQTSMYTVLYARDRQVPADIEQKFRDHVQELGIKEENMRFFEKEVSCFPE